MEKLGSDHRPVMVDLACETKRRRGTFLFDKRMVGKCHVAETVQEAWYRAGRMNENVSLLDRIGVTRRFLSKWKCENNNNSNERMVKLRYDLEIATSSTSPDYALIHELKSEIGKAFKEEEDFWKQKSIDKWLVVGDNNTSFFHAYVKASRQRNLLSKLIDEEEREYSTNEQMGQVAAEYFERLFKASSVSDMSGFFNGFEARVSEQMNQKLIDDVTDEEIREAVFSIKVSSAPGSDGMSGLFFQQYWDIIGMDVSQEVRSFFQRGVFPNLSDPQDCESVDDGGFETHQSMLCGIQDNLKNIG